MDICEDPIGIDARARTSGSTEVTHVDLEYGFWCNNDEQSEGECADFEVRYCCPKKQEKKCDEPGKGQQILRKFINWLQDTNGQSGLIVTIQSILVIGRTEKVLLPMLSV